MRNAFTFDVTTTSETTVSGSYAGAELEEKLTEEVHIGEEKETQRDEEEDKTVSSSVAIEFDCPAGAIKQVTVTKRHQKELIPVKGRVLPRFFDQDEAASLVESCGRRRQISQSQPR